MYTRNLGKTDIRISEIGFGAWAIGGDRWGQVDDTTSIKAMERGVELGINFIDTADQYGSGHSEEMVAQVLKGKRDKIVVSTKGGFLNLSDDPKRDPVFLTTNKVIEAFESSLRRLGTDYIDVYFCHLGWESPVETESFLGAFDLLKQAGKLRAAGVSTNDLNYVKNFNVHHTLDVVQLDYSILHRSAEAELLPYLLANKIGAVIKGPLAMGVLTGKFTSETAFPEIDLRHHWPQEGWYQDRLIKVEQLRPLENAHRTLGQTALRFVLNHPAVSVAIPGAKTIAQVESNAAASTRPLLSEQDLQVIESLLI